MIPNISEAEWRVMQVIWRRGPLTGNEVVEALADADWSPRTVKTLLNRLVKKKALSYSPEGRHYRYYALVDEAVCKRAETKAFLRRVYGGSLKPMLAHFLEEEELNEAEIEELKRLLEEGGETGEG